MKISKKHYKVAIFSPLTLALLLGCKSTLPIVPHPKSSQNANVTSLFVEGLSLKVGSALTSAELHRVR